MDARWVGQYLGLVVLLAPVLLVAVLGTTTLLSRKLGEWATVLWCQCTTLVGLLAALGMLGFMLVTGARHVTMDAGDWVVIPHYHLTIKFVFDRLSIPLVILSYLLTGTIGAFASKYLHREPGFNRFFTLYALFVLGMVVASLADTIETLFAGWEFVGLSSALLVAFFHDRPAPASNGLRVWIVYRISDAALLLAAVVLHHSVGGGHLDRIVAAGTWPDGQTLVPSSLALSVGLLLLVAASGKSALVPFSGWLPRAMEGPTPSSAIFYGALSVHLGAFLLLRVSALLDASLLLSGIVVALGLATAIHAYVVGSVQTDIKSALSYASLAQVGIIVTEIGLGFRYLPLVHLLGHACLRTLQFVRAPNVLQDRHRLENALGRRLPRLSGPWDRLAPGTWRAWTYRWALERGHLDDLLNFLVVTPFVRLFRGLDALERRLSHRLHGHDDHPQPPQRTTEHHESPGRTLA